MQAKKLTLAWALCAGSIGAQVPTSDPGAVSAAGSTQPASTSPVSAPADAASPAAPAPAPVAAPSAPSVAPQAAPVAAKPAPATPAAKPAAAAKSDVPAASAEPKSNAAPAASGSSSAPAAAGGDDQGFHFHPGATFGTLTVDGKTWTRLSFTPEISIGKLGVGFNLELFMDENQNLATKGWDFDTKRNSVESILRKFDYVRWDHPGAPFYARFGTLEGIDLGYGLVASGYGNMARYPDYKELGLDLQLNDLTSVGLDLETIVNNVQDVQNGGPFTVLKVGARPFKPMGIPLLDRLAVRVGSAYDWNQYAGLRDQDGDGCPDAVDASPVDPSTCVAPLVQKGLPFVPASVYNSADSAERAQSAALKKSYSARKPFGIYWAEASLPLVSTSFFGLELHSAFAKPETQDPDAADAGWGAIPLGAGSHIGPITLTAEYRYFSQPFQPGYFDALYEIQRAQFQGGKVVTKEQDIYRKGSQTGTMQGYFAGAGWDVFGFLKASADYSDLFPSKSSDDELRAAGAKVGIGPQVTGLLQNKIALAEIYWKKDRIGLDKWTDTTTHLSRHDSFLGNSAFTVYGYRVGSQIASGLTLVIDRQTSFVRDDKTGKLAKQNQMRIETLMKF